MKGSTFIIWILMFIGVSSYIVHNTSKKEKRDLPTTKKENGNDNLFTYVITLVLFFSAPFTWFAITTPSPIGFIRPEHQEAWLGFFGSIIGGAVTILGVYWTITEQNKQIKKEKRDRDQERKEELALQYKPIIKVTQPEDAYEKKVIFQTFLNTSGKLINILVYLENIGRGEAVDLSFSFANDNDDSPLTSLKHMNFDDLLFVKPSGTEFECIPTNQKTQLMLMIGLDEDCPDFDYISFILTIEYKNAFDKEEQLKHSAKITIRKSNLFNLDYEDPYIFLIKNIYTI